MTTHPKCICGHPRAAHEDIDHSRGECSAYLPVPLDIQQCPCPWYTPEDRSPQPRGGRVRRSA